MAEERNDTRATISSRLAELRAQSRKTSLIAQELETIAARLAQPDLASALRRELRGHVQHEETPGSSTPNFDRRAPLSALEMRSHSTRESDEVGTVSERIQTRRAEQTLEERRVYIVSLAEDLLSRVPEDAPEPWVITLHGIRTRGVWQKKLSPYLVGFRHEPLDYDFFDALQFVWPPARAKKVKWFSDVYGESRQKFKGRPSVIAHSFGTYMVTRAMEMYSLEFDRMILCGSIVRPDFPWSDFVGNRVSRVLHDFGGRDIWATLVAWFVADAGSSGSSGFTDDAGGHVVQRGNPWLGHSDYFHVHNFTKRWLPFLRGIDPEDLKSQSAGPNWRFRTLLFLLLLGLAAVAWWIFH